ncbi:hypothetical protein [Myroides indicus]|jgi:hypothetical protein|uniref:Uncharacterized protein n=1 Tax=Myroides indicus TaxID=1323422 RepID=A0A4R7F6B3_9FLAO|nr:hypothetical protein [Myroides indicus]TDS65300.1 hypothetical protein C8P70_10284 [Myroides indicus]
MKKIILASLMMLFGIASQAQETGNVTLNVKLHPIQTLIVNPAQDIVDLEYMSKDDYEDGVTSEVLEDHLEVFSTGGFAVTVKSSSAHLTTTAVGGAHGNIEANSIQIIPSSGTNAITNATNTSIALSQSEQTIVSSVYGAVDKTINIEYKGADANAYINYYVAGQNPTVYTTQLTYTIVAQ